MKYLECLNILTKQKPEIMPKDVLYLGSKIVEINNVKTKRIF